MTNLEKVELELLNKAVKALLAVCNEHVLSKLPIETVSDMSSINEAEYALGAIIQLIITKIEEVEERATY
jgi:hypothetical protein